MKKKKAIIIASITTVCLVAAGVVVVPKFVSAKSTDVTVSATQVRMGELSNYISVTGTVESTDSVKVFPETSEKITAVYVKLGDYVTEGQLLCELDSTEIEKSIDEQQSSMSLSSQTSYNQIKESERAYNDAASNLKNSTNSQLNSAENSLTNAGSDLESKQKTYNEKLAEYNDGTASRLTTAEKNVSTTKKELDTKAKDYEENLELYAVDAISKAELDSSKKAMETAEDNYTDALDALADVKKELSDELDNAKEALDNAQTAYDNAVTSLKTANVSVQQELVKYQENIESAKLSANNDSQVFTLQKLERQLEQTRITAPASGTITAVYAKVGETASGVLFVIEDTANLKIDTSIKEYDLSTMSVGLPAKIESDATGDDTYDGELLSIAPASEKDSTGATVSSTDVDFAAEVSVLSDNKLRIGSNARVDIIYEQSDNVMYLPVETVTTDREGTSYVYALTAVGSSDAQTGTRSSAASGEAVRPEMASGEAVRPEMASGEAVRPEMASDAGQAGEMPQGQTTDASTMYTVSRVEVTTGIETDLYIEVSGNLRPGMMIVSNPDLVSDGDIVKVGLNNSGFSSGSSTGGMGGMGGGMMRMGG